MLVQLHHQGRKPIPQQHPHQSGSEEVQAHTIWCLCFEAFNIIISACRARQPRNSKLLWLLGSQPCLHGLGDSFLIPNGVQKSMLGSLQYFSSMAPMLCNSMSILEESASWTRGRKLIKQAGCCLLSVQVKWHIVEGSPCELQHAKTICFKWLALSILRRHVWDQLTCRWLVGAHGDSNCGGKRPGTEKFCPHRQVSVSWADPQSRPALSIVASFQRKEIFCRYLAESNCAGMCVNLCKDSCTDLLHGGAGNAFDNETQLWGLQVCTEHILRQAWAAQSKAWSCFRQSSTRTMLEKMQGTLTRKTSLHCSVLLASLPCLLLLDAAVIWCLERCLSQRIRTTLIVKLACKAVPPPKSLPRNVSS